MPLLDHLGREIDMDKLKLAIVEDEIIRTGGSSVWGSEHASTGLTPQRLAGILRAAESGDPISYYALAEEMEEKDLHYLSVLGTRKRQVAQLKLTITPATEDKEGEDAAALVTDILTELLTESVLFDMLDAVGKGSSLTEIIWDTSANQWMPKQLQWVDPRMQDVDATRRNQVIKTIAGKLPLPPYKFITCEIKAKSGLAIRSGLARSVAWAWLFKNFGLKDWVRFAEAYGTPLRVGKFHAGATDPEKRALLRSVAALGSDAAAIIPQAMAIEFIEAKSQGSASGLFKDLASYLDQQVSKAVLGQTATTDAIAGGHAVGKEHNEVRGDIERSDAAALADVIGRDLVRPMVDLNLGPPKSRKYPLVKIGREDSQDAAGMVDAAYKLVPLGFRIKQSDVRAATGFSEPKDGDELFTPPAAAPNPDPAASPQERRGAPNDPLGLSHSLKTPGGGPYGPYLPLKGPAAVALARRSLLEGDAAGRRDRFDALADQLDRETAAAQDGFIDQLRAIVMDPTVTSMQEVGQRLLALQPSLSGDVLAAALGDALVVAEASGRAELAAGP